MTNKQTRFRRRGRKSRQQPTAEGEEGYDPYDFSKSETEGEEGRDQSPCVGHYFLTVFWNLGWSVLGKPPCVKGNPKQRGRLAWKRRNCFYLFRTSCLSSSLGIPFKQFLCFQVSLPLHLGFPLKGIPSEEAVCPEDMELFRFAGLL